MVFKRVWDSSCPRVWDTWERDGINWVIRDLPPEHDEEALDILLENLVPDETLCIASNLITDPLSMSSMKEFWRFHLSKRMSLACYREKNGESKLVALNVCLVECRDDEPDNFPIEGDAWINVYGALNVAGEKADAFEVLGVDKLLYALGLVVKKEYRGHRLGARILAARKKLSLHHGVTASSTVFTGAASQRSAELAGFRTIATVTFEELHEAGLNFDPAENKCIKLMVMNFK